MPEGMKTFFQQSEKPVLCESLVRVGTVLPGPAVLQEHPGCWQQPGHQSLPLPKGEAAGKELSKPICLMLGLVLDSFGGWLVFCHPTDCCSCQQKKTFCFKWYVLV